MLADTVQIRPQDMTGYKEPVDITFYTPNGIERTDQYVARRDKFYKWKELKSE